MLSVILIALCFAETGTINSFNSGEWSQKLAGRQDIKRYYAACQTCENFLPIAHGPVIKRSGTYYIATASGQYRLISFEKSTEQAYVLMFGDKTMEVFK